LEVEKLEAEAGKTFTFDKVLMVGDSKSVKVGKPYLEGAKVEAKVLEQKKDKKVVTFKKKSKKRYERTIGHRQPITSIEITEIKA
jgi:large subunit ribosomal protein L21